MFITFEGIEGSGKSTQRQLLLDWLISENINFVATREPGGTQIGQTFRELLLSNDSNIASNRTELFLFAADRCEHIAQVINPALERGEWVICDRYVDSTFAYQCGGREHDEADILDIIRLTNATVPDITFLLDLSPEEGLRRAEARGELDRFEKEAIQFHNRVRAAYLDWAKRHSDRTVVIPVDGCSVDEIFNLIKDEVKQRSQR